MTTPACGTVNVAARSMGRQIPVIALHGLFEPQVSQLSHAKSGTDDVTLWPVGRTPMSVAGVARRWLCAQPGARSRGRRALNGRAQPRGGLSYFVNSGRRRRGAGRHERGSACSPVTVSEEHPNGLRSFRPTPMPGITSSPTRSSPRPPPTGSLPAPHYATARLRTF